MPLLAAGKGSLGETAACGAQLLGELARGTVPVVWGEDGGLDPVSSHSSTRDQLLHSAVVNRAVLE